MVFVSSHGSYTDLGCYTDLCCYTIKPDTAHLDWLDDEGREDERDCEREQPPAGDVGAEAVAVQQDKDDGQRGERGTQRVADVHAPRGQRPRRPWPHGLADTAVTCITEFNYIFMLICVCLCVCVSV